MRLTTSLRRILLISCFALLNSCSNVQEAASTPTATSTPILVTPTSPVDQSIHSIDWLDEISQAETLWLSSKISSYEVVGRVRWAFHEHSFQVNVVDGQIVSSKCELADDRDVQWCETEFKASDYTIPALFKRARELADPQGECFYADFDFSTGVPQQMSFDCPNAYDEEEEWVIVFFQSAH